MPHQVGYTEIRLDIRAQQNQMVNMEAEIARGPAGLQSNTTFIRPLFLPANSFDIGSSHSDTTASCVLKSSESVIWLTMRLSHGAPLCIV
jgi:hypothetical protein